MRSPPRSVDDYGIGDPIVPSRLCVKHFSIEIIEALLLLPVHGLAGTTDVLFGEISEGPHEGANKGGPDSPAATFAAIGTSPIHHRQFRHL